MQTVDAEFTKEREAPVNVLGYHVEMDLLNYAASGRRASAVASTEFSADWPAKGAIDGDRSHINAGAPGAADNGIGRSVWQGSVVSGGDGSLGTPETLTITLAAVKKVNRLKLIFWPSGTKNGNLGSIAPADFLVEINPVLSGGSFSAWTGLGDRNYENGKDVLAISNGQVTGFADDYAVMEDPSLQTVGQIRITFTKLQSAGAKTRVVELELTRAVDLTPDITAISTKRAKDYKLNHRLASDVSLTLKNFDRKYSPSHVPASYETDFFNQEIKPNREIRVALGYGTNPNKFTGFGAGGFGDGPFGGFSSVISSRIMVFSGLLDGVEPAASGRLVILRGRDHFKNLIGRKFTSNLLTNKELEYLAEYIANRSNFPSNLMILETSTVAPGRFMPSDADMMTEMQKLTDALGDAEVLVDELNRIFFRSYLAVISHVFALSSQGDFDAGTYVNANASDNPGVVQLATSMGVYFKEGTWISALSPVLSFKVAWGEFDAVVEGGLSCNIDFFLRVSDDGGSTFTPFREIIAGQIISKLNPFSQIQIKARLRTSDTSVTPKLYNVTVKYKARGGSAKTQDVAVFEFNANKKTLLDVKQTCSELAGGANQIITSAIVKSSPTFVAAGSSTAWRATVNGEFVSSSNPMQAPLGVTTIQADLGGTEYDVPQTVNITFGSAAGSAVISSHPSKPTITLTITTAGTITDLNISGKALVKQGTIEVTSLAPVENLADYGVQEETISNDYIDNTDFASDVAQTIIGLFKDPLSWLPSVVVPLTPEIQINDRARIVEPNLDIDADYFPISVQHDIQVMVGGGSTAKTTMEMVKVGSRGGKTFPAKFGGGILFDTFKFGGDATLVVTA